jgi:4'-phosphopantetheinyl transferase EntD
MTTVTNPELGRAIAAMSVPGLLVEHRLITDGDELRLLPDEFASFAGSILKVRRASAAARLAARTLLPHFGLRPVAIAKSIAGMPIWPDGIVGSLAHDSHIAVAAVAQKRDFLGVGVDVEPATTLDADLVDMVTTERERSWVGNDLHRARLLFSVKEAVYKAVYPLDGTFLDHQDVEVDIGARTAVIRNGRVVTVHCCALPHIVALAFVLATKAATPA